MARVADASAAHEVTHGVLHGARAQIAADRAAGYGLVMATACTVTPRRSAGCWALTM